MNRPECGRGPCWKGADHDGPCEPGGAHDPRRTAEEDATLAAYAIACPRCRSAAGDPCRERYCVNGYAGCTYKVCSRIRDLDTPHVARVARAVTTVTPPGAGREGETSCP